MSETDDRLAEVWARLQAAFAVSYVARAKDTPKADADFVAHARDDMHWLLELVEQLRARVGCAETEAADLREQLEGANRVALAYLERGKILRQQLATAEALVPEAEWLEMVALSEAPLGPADCAECPFDGPGRCDVQCNNFDAWAVTTAAAIRDWREEQGREGESDNDA